MADLTRRLFLGGALALVGASVLSSEVAAATIPRIVGDGWHDDTDGLQALFDGNPVNIEGNVVAYQADSHGYLDRGTFRITRTVHVRTQNWTWGTVCIRCAEVETGSVLDFRGSYNNWVHNLHVEGNPRGLPLMGAGCDAIIRFNDAKLPAHYLNA